MAKPGPKPKWRYVQRWDDTQRAIIHEFLRSHADECARALQSVEHCPHPRLQSWHDGTAKHWHKLLTLILYLNDRADEKVRIPINPKVA